MWHRVEVVLTDVSEERIASIFRVEGKKRKSARKASVRDVKSKLVGIPVNLRRVLFQNIPAGAHTSACQGIRRREAVRNFENHEDIKRCKSHPNRAILIKSVLCGSVLYTHGRKCISRFSCLCPVKVRIPGYRSRGLGFDSRRYHIFWEVVCLERGPLSLLRITEELFQPLTEMNTGNLLGG
jgi:hypothetical protein